VLLLDNTGIINEILSSRKSRLQWWREARYGLFIHWGLYAVAGGVWNNSMIPGVGEWIMFMEKIPVKTYRELAKLFNPVEFDPKEWARIAKESGFKYLVITAKHHDGFCLFDSSLTNYNVVSSTPFGRDVIKEVTQAFKSEGIKVGFYYSQTLDWFHKDALGNEWDYDPWSKNFRRYFYEYSIPQVIELIKKYDPDIMWFDIGCPTHDYARDLRIEIHKANPNIIVNGRIDPWTIRYDFLISKDFRYLCRRGIMFGDYLELHDNTIPPYTLECDWEVPITHNGTWGWRSWDHEWRSTGKLLQTLITVVSRNGNLLINTGPTPTGKIPHESLTMFLEIGSWLKKNGESIYGTYAAPIDTPSSTIYKLTYRPCKSKEDEIYVHLIGWPWNGQLRIYNILQKFDVGEAYVLETMQALNMKKSGNDLVIEGLPYSPINRLVTVLKLEAQPKEV